MSKKSANNAVIRWPASPAISRLPNHLDAEARHDAVAGYYGHVFGDGVISANYEGQSANYGYVEASLAF